MTDQVLDILKLVLLALLYLFFARVLWAVWSEVRAPRVNRTGAAPVPMMPAGGDGPTVSAERPAVAPVPKPRKGRGGRVARLVVVEPKARRGAAWALTGEITIGRDPACTITIDEDTFVSGMHARVFDHDGQPMVEDLGSTNGSFHNGNKLVGMKLLHPGDRIQIGYTVLEAQ
jgi:hypothetical protein